VRRGVGVVQATRAAKVLVPGSVVRKVLAGLRGVAALIDQLIAALPTTATTGSGDQAWLFQGSRSGQPITRPALSLRLNAFAINITLGRNTALMDLASEMPAAAVLTGLLILRRGSSGLRRRCWCRGGGRAPCTTQSLSYVDV